MTEHEKQQLKMSWIAYARAQDEVQLVRDTFSMHNVYTRELSDPTVDAGQRMRTAIILDVLGDEMNERGLHYLPDVSVLSEWGLFE